MVGRYFVELQKRSGFEKLEQREKVIIVLGISIFIGFVLLQFGVGPYLKASGSLDRALVKNRSDIVELQLLQQEYQNLQAEAGGIREQLKKRAVNFSLFSFLDKQASEAEVKNFISYMKPSTSERRDGELIESSVEMKLQEISLRQFVDFLKRIESPENVVSIQRISIQESGKVAGGLDIIIRIMTFVENVEQ